MNHLAALAVDLAEKMVSGHIAFARSQVDNDTVAESLD
jgi:hypothetical protein